MLPSLTGIVWGSIASIGQGGREQNPEANENKGCKNQVRDTAEC